MLYLIGKDSSVMLRLAQKALSPGKPPFPLLHVDTSYKFPEMIAFRDWYAGEAGVVRSQSRTKRRFPKFFRIAIWISMPRIWTHTTKLRSSRHSNS